MEWGRGTIVHSDSRRVGDRRRTDDVGPRKPPFTYQGVQRRRWVGM